MDNGNADQIINLINKSNRILLLTHAKADCDGLGSMISMYLVLQKLGKEVIAATNDPAPENLSFLPSMDIVQNSLVATKDFIITLDITKTPLSKIKYNLQNNRVNIVITPKGGQFSEADVSFDHQSTGEDKKFDLIMVFDTGNLEHLGPIYDDNSELFFETPIINIDHHVSNTDYGQVNAVDVVAASTTQVLLGIFETMEKKLDQKFLTEEIATLLLAGLITDTGSFQHANTSPNSMETAARLLDLGARQQEIIKNIYKTKKLSTLKLWGIVLSKVEADPIYRIVWSTISKENLEETGAASEEAEGIIDDLLSNAPNAEAIMLIKYNEEGYISISMRSTTNSVDVGQICTEMGGGGHIRAAGYKVRDGRGLDEVTTEALKKVREYQGKRLNIHPDTVHQPNGHEGKQESQTNENEEVVQNNKPPKSVQYLEFKNPSTEKQEVKEAPKAEKPPEPPVKNPVPEPVKVVTKAEVKAVTKPPAQEKQERKRDDDSGKGKSNVQENERNKSNRGNNRGNKGANKSPAVNKTEPKKEVKSDLGEEIKAMESPINIGATPPSKEPVKAETEVVNTVAKPPEPVAPPVAETAVPKTTQQMINPQPLANMSTPITPTAEITMPPPVAAPQAETPPPVVAPPAQPTVTPAPPSEEKQVSPTVQTAPASESPVEDPAKAVVETEAKPEVEAVPAAEADSEKQAPAWLQPETPPPPPPM